MYKIIIYSILLSISCTYTAQSQYTFKVDKQVACTPVKNQNRTGTCWSFATASFLESEVIKNTDGEINLSEMFVVRKIYEDKAQNYILRQGKANFSQGSLSHDLIRVTSKYGVLPEESYSGRNNGEETHDHSELENAVKGYLDGVLATKKKSNRWKKGVSALLDIYLGPVPEQFTASNKEYTIDSYNADMGLNADDYISITSFSHHPFYSEFILEIPDNYSNGAYYNVPINELVDIIDYALMNGYTIAWDGDVSEKGFSAKEGIAVLPVEASREDLFQKPGDEMVVTQSNRQAAFENMSTTDDHLMHLVGISLDQNGKKYYVIKNSWGQISPYKGYLHMSEAYLKMKTVSIMMNKNGMSEKIGRKLLSTTSPGQ